ncbi:MAG: hypothetical protein H6744_08645 [Deltaproteobacteria bacterium]|nr:hypothetical protein [Deltaproteobacteria bacterium]MCB9786746.1 hypothetical protein [Deltaproteobacteria bacterium]
MSLGPAQVTRYARHLLLSGVGRAGQARLLASTVAVSGTGLAAEEAAIYLAAAGVGRLVLDPELAGRLGDGLQAQNPDVTVCTEGSADLLLDRAEPDTRLVGSMAALSALVELSGAGPRPAWNLPETDIRWKRC